MAKARPAALPLGRGNLVEVPQEVQMSVCYANIAKKEKAPPFRRDLSLNLLIYLQTPVQK
jgi:hypothetical protein